MNIKLSKCECQCWLFSFKKSKDDLFTRISTTKQTKSLRIRMMELYSCQTWNHRIIQFFRSSFTSFLLNLSSWNLFIFFYFLPFSFIKSKMPSKYLSFSVSNSDSVSRTWSLRLKIHNYCWASWQEMRQKSELTFIWFSTFWRKMNNAREKSKRAREKRKREIKWNQIE
jgi:hypothetical protein